MQKESNSGLSRVEKDQVLKLAPRYQRKIHMSFHGSIQNDKLKDDNAIILLTEHFVVIIIQNQKDRVLEVLYSIHFFSISFVEIIDSETIMIESQSCGKLHIKSKDCVMFARNLSKNYAVASSLLPDRHRWKVVTRKKGKIGRLEPLMSFSQRFQFTYNAYCSFYKVRYNHPIVKYIHNLLQAHNPFFDSKQLPTHIVDSNLGSAADFQPVASSLKYFPYIQSFSLNHISSKNIISAISSLVISNENIKIISLVDVGATNGCNKLSNAIKHSKKNSILFWDLSDNVIEDINDFTTSLIKYKSTLYGLRLNNVQMNELAITNLFQSLTNNKNLHEIKELSLVGNKISKNNCQNIRKWIKTLKSNKKFYLQHLSLGPLSKPPLITDLIDGCNQPLTVVRIVDSKLTDDSLYDISRFLLRTSTLKEFDISGCSISNKAFRSVLKALQENTKIQQLSLGLNRLKLHGSKIKTLTEFLSKGLSNKIVEIHIDNNGITDKELNEFIVNVHVMHQLKKLSISGTFGHKNPNIIETILALLTSKTLEVLTIKGNSKTYLMNQAIPILCGLFDNKIIKNINFSHNKIGEIGVKTASNLIRANNNIQSLEIDGSGVTNIETIYDYLEACAQSKSLLEAKVPKIDLENIVLNKTLNEKSDILNKIAQLQDKVNQNLFRNRNKFGIQSSLSLQQNPIIDEIIELAVEQNKKLMGNMNVNDLNDLSKLYGIPLPTQTFSDITNRGSDFNKVTMNSLNSIESNRFNFQSVDNIKSKNRTKKNDKKLEENYDPELKHTKLSDDDNKKNKNVKKNKEKESETSDEETETETELDEENTEENETDSGEAESNDQNETESNNEDTDESTENDSESDTEVSDKESSEHEQYSEDSEADTSDQETEQSSDETESETSESE